MRNLRCFCSANYLNPLKEVFMYVVALIIESLIDFRGSICMCKRTDFGGPNTEY